MTLVVAPSGAPMPSRAHYERPLYGLTEGEIGIVEGKG